jgi:glycosyltransferase involved in cell wall biosynthesis
MAHLQEAVDSILAQTYSNLDVVLVDGGSTDGSREWIHGIDDPRVRAHSMPHGTTAADNWTAASREARGEYIKLMCQDDSLRPNAIEVQLEDLNQHPEALFAIGQRDIVDARSALIYPRRGCAGLPAGLVNGHVALKASYLNGTNIFGEPLAVLFRREPLNAALSWNDERPFLLDLELYTRVLQEGPIAVRRESVGAFRVSSSSWSTRLVKEQLEQISHWQAEVAEFLEPRPTALERARARVGLHKQMMLRRAAYRALKLRRAFRSAHDG